MPPPSAYLTNDSFGPSTSWLPDSGASFHVIGDASNLQQITPFEGHYQIYIGNDQGLHILSVGSSTFPSPTHPYLSLTLYYLLHVPSITNNLISVSQFCRDSNVYFLFTTNECLVKSQTTNLSLLQGRVGSDGLYEFPAINLTSTKSFSTSICVPSVNTISTVTNTHCVSPSSQYMWHLRLGHPNHHTLKHVLQHCNSSTSNKDLLQLLIHTPHTLSHSNLLSVICGGPHLVHLF